MHRSHVQKSKADESTTDQCAGVTATMGRSSRSLYACGAACPPRRLGQAAEVVHEAYFRGEGAGQEGSADHEHLLRESTIDRRAGARSALRVFVIAKRPSRWTERYMRSAPCYVLRLGADKILLWGGFVKVSSMNGHSVEFTLTRLWQASLTMWGLQIVWQRA
jgi:hypothetical protein